VTLSTDNRMSATSLSEEMEFARSQHGFEPNDLARVTRADLDPVWN
jgi:adenosine deaminase